MFKKDYELPLVGDEDQLGGLSPSCKHLQELGVDYGVFHVGGCNRPLPRRPARPRHIHDHGALDCTEEVVGTIETLRIEVHTYT